LIIDSHALIHRAYHAVPPLKNFKGESIGAVYGFAAILVSNIAQLKPDYLVACFDLPKPTLRHKKFADYKGTRPKAPDDLISQFSLVRKFLEALEIPVLEKEGYEADDAIGTVVEIMSKKHKDIDNVVSTGDLDTLQLINSQTKILTPKRGISDPILYGKEELAKKLPGLVPEQVVDYKGLRGDSSDNIPGVPGVGEKTSIKLINHFKNLENLYKEIEDKKKIKKILEDKIVGKAVFQKLTDNKDLAFFSRDLATIYRDAPINFNLKGAIWNPNPANIEQILLDFGFRSLVRRYQAISQGIELPKFEKTPQQKDLKKQTLRQVQDEKSEPDRQDSLF
jgi:DNA polymerase I